jgi:hypothetical protein
MTSLGDTVVAIARRDIGVKTDSQRVKQMLANYGIHSQANWCAVATGTWIQEAAASQNQASPIAGSPLAQETMRQFQKAGLWVPAPIAPFGLKVGMVPVWRRGPQGSALGHIGVVSATSAIGFSSIEGNADGGAVEENTHFYDSSSLLGAGFFPPYGAPPPEGIAKALLIAGGIVGAAGLLAYLLVRKR